MNIIEKKVENVKIAIICGSENYSLLLKPWKEKTNDS